MAHEAIFYGFIEGRTWRKDFRHLYELNPKVLESLPARDSFPYLPRDVFSCTPPDSSGTFCAPIIHFGGSMNHLDFGAVPDWIEKFESLLRKLYWHEATAHIWTDYIDGAYQFWWKADHEAFANVTPGRPQPTTFWRRREMRLVRSLEEPPRELPDV